MSNTYKKLHHLSLLLIVALAVVSCSDDEKFAFVADVITVNKVADAGNKSDASDFWAEVSLDENSIKSIVEIRTIFVDATLNSGELSENEILNLQSGRFHSVSKFNLLDKNKLIIEPAASITDTNGAAVVNGKLYKIIIAAIGKDNAISISNPIDYLPSADSPFSGRYTGVWSDELIPSLNVSLIIFEDFTGRLYYTGAFRPCCGGTEDAKLEMQLNDTGTATFNFNQFLGDYPRGTGGHCVTQMSTIGKLDDNVLILESFPFSDCDGGGRTVEISSLTRI